MAKQTLPTNFIDDILAPSMGGKRKYRIIDNGDGTYSFEDVTTYTQDGSDFGAGQINATNQAINESCDKANVIETMDDIMANQASGMIAGAKAVAELNGNLKSQNVIWTGSTYLGGDQTVRLSEKISDQKSGICLIWRRYNPGEGNVSGMCYSFIPKYALTFGSGMTHTVWITNYTGGYAATKTFYLSDSEITGHASNETGSTIQGTSGITTNNNRFALVGVVGC